MRHPTWVKAVARFSFPSGYRHPYETEKGIEKMQEKYRNSVKKHGDGFELVHVELPRELWYQILDSLPASEDLTPYINRLIRQGMQAEGKL